MEEDGVPCGVAGFALGAGGLDAVGDFDWGGPAAVFETGEPDGDVGVFLSGATEPCGDEACRGFGDGGGVAGGEGCGFVEEFLFEERVGGLGEEGGGEQRGELEEERAGEARGGVRHDLGSVRGGGRSGKSADEGAERLA